MLHMPTPMMFGGDAFDADALAYIAAMSVQPDAARKLLINSLVVGLKDSGVWAKMDCLWLVAAHDAQAGRLNAKAPSRFALTPQLGPTYTTDRGYTCNGTSSWLGTGFTPGFSSNVLFSQNSAHVSSWLNQVLSDAADDSGNDSISIGAIGDSSRVLVRPRTSVGVQVKLNDAFQRVGMSATTKLGLTAGSRVSDSETIIQRNATSVSVSATSAATQATQIALMRADFGYEGGFDSFYMQGRVAFASIGAGLTSGELVALYSHVSAYLTAIGAA